MRKYIGYVGVSILGLLLMTASSIPDGNLRMIACDVGQGDATLITQGFSQVLVDGGPNDKVGLCLEEHMPWYDHNLEVVVLSHPQDDHMAGLAGVVKQYRVGLLVANGVVGQTKKFAEFRQAILDQGVAVYAPKMGEKMRVGKMKITFWWPEEREGDPEIWKDYNTLDQARVLGAFEGDLNQVCVAFKLEYDGVSMLLTGDIGTREELAILDSGVITPVDVLKVAHHGSKMSSSIGFLEAIRPKWGLISAGDKNNYGHPSSDTLTRLDIVGTEVFRTDTMGEIVLITDGETIWLGE